MKSGPQRFPSNLTLESFFYTYLQREKEGGKEGERGREREGRRRKEWRNCKTYKDH